MKRRALFSLIVFVFSGICLAGCAAPRSPGDTEVRLQNLENKVASYSELRTRVDALEKAAREKGIMEPALSSENLPPLPDQPAVGQNPHSDFVVSSVPGQKEVTTAPAPETKTAAPTPAPTPVAAKESPAPAPTPAPLTAKEGNPPTETPSPFTAKQATPPQDTPSPFSATNKPPVVEAKERQPRTAEAQAAQPPLPQLDTVPQAQAQPVAQAQPMPEATPQSTAQNPPPPAPKPAPNPAPAPKPAPTTEKGTYEAALALYEAGKYTDSRKAMTGFLETYPTSAYVPNALYWIGESHYSQSQWDQAILSFKDVVARFPKHAKAADALLKLGMSYEQLKDKDNARFHYEALIEDFPASRAAGLAKQKLAKL